MIRLDDVRARIEAKVPDLVNRLGNAAQFSKVIEDKLLPQQTPWGFVLPGPLTGRDATSSTGRFIQNLAETVLVVLTVRASGDPFGAQALDEVTPLVRAVILGVVGWGPAGAPGVFILQRAELAGSIEGWIFYEIAIDLSDQVRVTP